MAHARIRAHEPVIATVAEIHLGKTIEIICHTPLHVRATTRQEIRLTATYSIQPGFAGRTFGIRFESTLGEQRDAPHEVRSPPALPTHGTLKQQYDFQDPGDQLGEIRITVSEERPSGPKGRPGQEETVGIGSIGVTVA